MEPDAVVVQNLQREKQIRHHALRLRQLGAPEEAIGALVANLLENPPLAADPALGQTATAEARDAAADAPKSADCAGQPRGVLGFRIYSKGRKLYSVFKEPPGTALDALAPETTPPRKQAGLSGRKRGGVRGAPD